MFRIWKIQKGLLCRESREMRIEIGFIFSVFYISYLILEFTFVDDDRFANKRRSFTWNIWKPRGIEKKFNLAKSSVPRALFIRADLSCWFSVNDRRQRQRVFSYVRVFLREPRMFVFRYFDPRVASFTCAFCYTSLPRFLVSLAVSTLLRTSASYTVSIPELVEAFVGQ